jgi:hypothetical protein
MKPNDRRDEINGIEEVLSGLIIPSGDSAILLEFCEKVCNKMVSTIEVLLTRKLLAAIRFSGNNLRDLECGIAAGLEYQRDQQWLKRHPR